VDRFKLGQFIGQSDKEGAQSDSIFSRMVSSEIENIYQLTRNIRVSDFCDCVDRVLKADRLVIIGSQASTSLVIHMFQMLSKILEQVDKITHHAIEAAAIIRRLTSASVAFVICFPRYAKITLDIAHALREKGVYIVVLTDNHISPAIEMSNMTFFIPVDVPSFVDGYASPIAFINALASEISMRHPTNSQKALEHYDEIVHKHKLFTQKSTEWQAIELEKMSEKKQLHSKKGRRT
jgi:DNA-binding MurR/RpiR family transcriptional regulator